MAKVIRNRWVFRPHGKWHRYLPRRNDAVKEYDYEVAGGSLPEFSASLPDSEKPTQSPKLWLAWVYRDLATEPKWTKERVEKLFGANSKPGRMEIFPNTAAFNQELWRVKHLIELHPLTFPNGEPTKDDITALQITPDGVCSVNEKARVNDSDLQLYDQTKQWSSVELRSQLAKKYFGFQDVFETNVYSPSNISVMKMDMENDENNMEHQMEIEMRKDDYHQSPMQEGGDFSANRSHDGTGGGEMLNPDGAYGSNPEGNYGGGEYAGGYAGGEQEYSFTEGMEGGDQMDGSFRGGWRGRGFVPRGAWRGGDNRGAFRGAPASGAGAPPSRDFGAGDGQTQTQFGYRGRGGFRGSPRGSFPGIRGMPPFPPRGMFRGRGYAGMRPPFMPPYGFPPGQTQGPSSTERLKTLAGCQGEEELWVETKTEEGKSYYYHAITRQTIWEEPENAKIVSQEELQKLVQQVQDEEKEKAAAMPPPGMPPMGFPPMGMPPFGGMPGIGAPPQTPDEAWQEFTAPDGRKYYFNAITQENTWEKPKALVDKENGVTPEPAAPPNAAHIIAQQALAAVQAEVQNKMAEAQKVKARERDEMKTQTSHGGGDKSRPVTSTPVSGTPWCVVWTGDNKVFFYNPSTKTSVWERPPELYNRDDVDVLVREPPKPDKKDDATPSQAADSEGGSDNDDSDEEGGPPVKKSRQEKKREQQLKQQIANKKDKAPVRQMLEKPVDPAIQAELQAQQERQKLPHADRLLQFKEMLIEKDIATGSTFEKELSKIVFDPRYLLLSATERRAAFDAYVKEKTEKERAEKKKRAKEAKEKFQEMLKEAELHGKSSFSSFASKFGKDSRFKGVEKMRDREDLFNEFVGELHKKEKEERKEKKEKSKKAFIALIEEQKGLTRKSKWREVKKTIEDDERYKDKYMDSSLRESLFKDFVEKLGDETASDAEEEAEREKRLAAEAAIAKRQEEVEAELGEKLHERKKESERHRIIEHEGNFNALCNDLIKSADMTWHEARRVLRKDDRYSQCDLLDKSQKESLFEEHLRSLEKRRREAFKKLLDEHETINTSFRWKDARKVIEKEELFQKCLGQMSERKIEREFRDWVEERHEEALRDFKDLLKETKIITYESKKKMEDSEQHLKDILAVLEKDKRYLVMKDSVSQRDRILEEYIDKLARAGPPPPPTQQEARR